MSFRRRLSIFFSHVIRIPLIEQSGAFAKGRLMETREEKKKGKNKNMKKKKTFNKEARTPGQLGSGFGEGDASTSAGYSRTPRN